MSIEKEILFRAVMRNEVLLWAGSGLSLYAGYPSGWGLGQILHDGLTPSQRPMLDPNDPLPRYVERYVTLHNERRNELNRELLRVFSAAPTSLTTHQKLATVPFIDQIVTTNYDSLFELAYGHRLHKITHGKNIPLGEQNQVTLYKIHGDLQDPDSLIIADSDFRGFFRKNDKILWTALEALMAKRHIVFIGYSLEDPNVKELYEWLREHLGSQMREAFFIAPNQNELNRKWMDKHNLTYIDSTGEAFVDELVTELKESVLSDLKKGVVSQDKASQFLSGLGMDFGYKNNSHGLDITYLAKKDGETTQEFSFTVNANTHSSEDLKRVMSGEILDPIKLSADDDLKGIVRVEGLRMPDDIVSVIIAPAAFHDKLLDVTFSDGTYFSDVNIRTYGNKKEIRIIAKTIFNTIRVTLLRSDFEKESAGFNVNMIVGGRGAQFTSTHALVENAEILRCLGLGLGFRCMEQGQTFYEELSRATTTEIIESSQNLKNTIENIRFIEKHFSIIFKNFKLTNSEQDDITFLANVLRLEGTKSPLKLPIIFTIDDSEEGRRYKETLTSPEHVGAIALKRMETWLIDFFGWKFEIKTLGIHVLNKSHIEYDSNLNKYSASNEKKDLYFIPEEVISKRIVERPELISKSKDITFGDILDDWG